MKFYFDLRRVEKTDITLCCRKLQQRTAEHFWLHVSGIPGIQQGALTPPWLDLSEGEGHLFKRRHQTHPWTEDHKTPDILGAGVFLPIQHFKKDDDRMVQRSDVCKKQFHFVLYPRKDNKLLIGWQFFITKPWS